MTILDLGFRLGFNIYHIVASRSTSWLVTPHITNWDNSISNMGCQKIKVVQSLRYPGYLQTHHSRPSNIAFLLEWAQMLDLDFGLIRQNISFKKAFFQYQGCPLSFKSGKLWLNSYIYWISITSNWFYSQQFSLPYSKNILLVFPFRGDKKKKKKVLATSSEKT